MAGEPGLEIPDAFRDFHQSWPLKDEERSRLSPDTGGRYVAYGSAAPKSVMVNVVAYLMIDENGVASEPYFEVSLGGTGTEGKRPGPGHQRGGSADRVPSAR